MEGRIAGYGASKSWIQEYERLLKRPLKKFTIIDKETVDKFEVYLHELNSEWNFIFLNLERSNQTRTL